MVDSVAHQMHERISDSIAEQLIEPEVGADDFKINLLVNRARRGSSGAGRALQDRSERNHPQSNHLALQLQKRTANFLRLRLKLRLLFGGKSTRPTVQCRSCEP